VSVASVLAAGRVAHLALMVDVCTISRPSTRSSWDPVTGTYVERPATVVYTGPCLVKPGARASGDVNEGAREVTTSRYEVALSSSTSAAPVEVGDLLTVTVSTDGWLVDRPLLVLAVGLGSACTARWVSVEDQRG
jgi:Family of unknown function (DUF6093)